MSTTKPELTAERIAEVRRVAELKIAARAKYQSATLDEIVERAETTLALIESRKQALELLRLAYGQDRNWAKNSNRDAMGYGGIAADVAEQIAAFLESNQ